MGSRMYPESAKVRLGNEVAVQQGSRALSFEELDTYSTRFTSWLVGHGLTQGDWVAVQMPMCLELAVIECALRKAGLRIAGICVFTPPEEVSRIVESCAARAFIASSALCSYSAETRGFESISAFASVGARVSGYAEYGELIAKESSRSSTQPHVTPRAPAQSTADKTSKATTATNFVHPRSRIALVGPFNRVLPQVMQPYLDSGSPLILFDNIEVPEFGHAMAAKDITHVLLAADTAFHLIDRNAGTKVEESRVVVTDDLAAGRMQDKTRHVNGTGGGRDCAAAEAEAEAEAALLAHPAVMEACVIKVPDEGKEETLKAVVALRSGGRASEAELIAHCLARLPYNLCPGSVSFVAELPKNASGNPARKLIREQYLQAYRLPY